MNTRIPLGFLVQHFLHTGAWRLSVINFVVCVGVFLVAWYIHLDVSLLDLALGAGGLPVWHTHDAFSQLEVLAADFADGEGGEYEGDDATTLPPPYTCGLEILARQESHYRKVEAFVQRKHPKAFAHIEGIAQGFSSLRPLLSSRTGTSDTDDIATSGVDENVKRKNGEVIEVVNSV